MKTIVLGPAYLDRVLRVDRPLVDPRLGPALDHSVDGAWERDGSGSLTFNDPQGGSLAVAPAEDWPGPTGTVRLSRPLIEGAPPWRREVRCLAWRDELGGMGAGYAASLGGLLVSALGPESDLTSRVVAERLGLAGIDHRPIRVEGRSADWTLLITSGEFGDKLPIGFRGCHAALDSFGKWAYEPCDLRIVAALPNRLASTALQAEGAAVRFFAPTMRNVVDRDWPIADFAGSIDILSCNRREWETISNRNVVALRVPIVAVTDGPNGSSVRYRTADGGSDLLRVPAFPRDRVPSDTNRAGEAYASALLSSLIDGGWRAGLVDVDLVKAAAARASAAAALILDRLDFSFPTAREIDDVLLAGRVAATE